MGNKLTKANVKRYLTAMKNSGKKYVTVEMLSKMVGIKEDVIREELTEFDPMIRLMEDYNLKDIVKPMEEYISKPMVVRSKPTVKYASVMDFVVKNMTSNGDLLNKYMKLDKTQLKDLEIVVKRELRKSKW